MLAAVLQVCGTDIDPTRWALPIPGGAAGRPAGGDVLADRDAGAAHPAPKAKSSRPDMTVARVPMAPTAEARMVCGLNGPPASMPLRMLLLKKLLPRKPPRAVLFDPSSRPVR